jgi:hypothetical protein
VHYFSASISSFQIQSTCSTGVFVRNDSYLSTFNAHKKWSHVTCQTLHCSKKFHSFTVCIPQIISVCHYVFCVMGIQNFFGKGPQPLWLGSFWTTPVKTAISGIPNHISYCVIFIACTLIYKCGLRPHNTTREMTGWTHVLYQK